MLLLWMWSDEVSNCSCSWWSIARPSCCHTRSCGLCGKFWLSHCPQFSTVWNCWHSGAQTVLYYCIWLCRTAARPARDHRAKGLYGVYYVCPSFLSTTTIDILVYYLFSRHQWTACVRAVNTLALFDAPFSENRNKIFTRRLWTNFYYVFHYLQPSHGRYRRVLCVSEWSRR